MLPNISKRNQLFGFDRRRYDSVQLHAAINLKVHDGFTSDNAVDIIKRINGYLEESRYLVIQGSVIFMFIRDIRDGKLEAEGNMLLDAYCKNIDKAVLSQSMSNIIRVVKSIASQRRLMQSAKPFIKKNKISRDWDNLLNSTLDDLDERMKYLREIIIPENIIYTPFGAYINYLKDNRGITIYEDILNYVPNNGSLFDDDGSATALIYMQHVVEILRRIDDKKEIDKLIQSANNAFEERSKRLEKIKKDHENVMAQKYKRDAEEAKEIVLALCSVAEKDFCNERSRTLKYWAKNCTQAFVIAASRINPVKSGYLCRDRGKWCVTNVRRAKVFTTEESALKAAEEYRAQGDNLFAEISRIDLFAHFGFGD